MPVVLLFNTECEEEIIVLPSGSMHQFNASLSPTTSCRWVIHAAPGEKVRGRIINSPSPPINLYIGSLDKPYKTGLTSVPSSNTTFISPNEVLVFTWKKSELSSRRKRQIEGEQLITINVTSAEAQGNDPGGATQI